MIAAGIAPFPGPVRRKDSLGGGRGAWRGRWCCSGPGTRIIDLKGRLALPAFGDAHVHPVGGGLESLRCNLVGKRTRPEYLDVIAGYAR